MEKNNEFKSESHFTDSLESAIVRSEIEGGVWIKHVIDNTEVLPVGSKIKVETQNRVYSIEKISDNEFIISGHPEFCPKPTLVHITGSTWTTGQTNCALKQGFIGRGMHLEFILPDVRTIYTSQIKNITEEN